MPNFDDLVPVQPPIESPPIGWPLPATNGATLHLGRSACNELSESTCGCSIRSVAPGESLYLCIYRSGVLLAAEADLLFQPQTDWPDELTIATIATGGSGGIEFEVPEVLHGVRYDLILDLKLEPGPGEQDLRFVVPHDLIGNNAQV